MNSTDWARIFYKTGAFVLIAALMMMGLQAASYFRDVLTILVSALLLAYVLQLAVEPLSRRMPRWSAVLIVTVGFVLSITIVAALVIPLIVEQVRLLLINLPSELERLQAQLTNLEKLLADRRVDVELRLDQYVVPRLEGWTQHLASLLPGILLGSVASFFSFALISVAAFYLLKDGPRLWTACIELLPARVQSQCEYLRYELDQSLHCYFRGQIINASIVLFSTSIIFSLLGMNYGIVAGTLWGLAEIIPYFGVWVGLSISLILAALQGGIFLKVLVAGVLIWWIKDNVIAPRVMSHTTGLHPVMVMMAVLTGGKLAGFLGVLLAIPVTAVAVTIIRFWLLQQKHRELGAMPTPPQPAVELPAVPPSPAGDGV